MPHTSCNLKDTMTTFLTYIPVRMCVLGCVHNIYINATECAILKTCKYV